MRINEGNLDQPDALDGPVVSPEATITYIRLSPALLAFFFLGHNRQAPAIRQPTDALLLNDGAQRAVLLHNGATSVLITNGA